MFALGLGGLAQFVPMFALTLYAGDVADRYERRRVLSASYTVEAACAAIFMALTLSGVTDTWPYFATLVLFGAARAFSAPASQSFLPQIVPASDLPQAISISSTRSWPNSCAAFRRRWAHSRMIFSCWAWPIAWQA